MSDLSDEDIRDHHHRVEGAVAPLGALGGDPTLAVTDKTGWYITRDNTDPTEEEVGKYPKERRARNFVADYAGVVDSSLERTFYALTSYKRPEAFDRWEPARFDEDEGAYEYLNEKPTPHVEDITAISAWGDIDLADGLKPQRADLDEETYATAETVLEAHIDAFADLYGGRDALYALDSVGGAYIFGAPEATLPITRHYEDDADARGRVLSAFIERSNEFFEEAMERINERVEGAAETIDPDWANNPNRQYKIPLTIHSDHDAVVTPLDVEDVRYREPVAVEDVDDDLLDEAREWCEAFTDREYEDRVEDLVAALWPDEYDEHDGWEAALDAWVEAEREREEREEQRRQAARERREKRMEELGDGLEGKPITPFMEDVYEALDDIDTADVVKKHASDGWDTGTDESGKTEFDPSWRRSESGTSCYVDHDKNRFGDAGESGGGYATKAMALGRGIITDASDDLDGEEWGEAVAALRDAGYDIPIWIPEVGSKRRNGDRFEKMPFWAVRKAAVALGDFPEDGFVEQTNDDGDTYPGFPGQESYKNALNAIKEAGLEHGRERENSGPGDDSAPEEEYISEKDGWYGYWADRSDDDEPTNWVFVEEANFTLDVNAFLERDDETYFDIDVTSVTGEQYQCQVLPTVFNEKRDFKRAIVTGTSTVAHPRRSSAEQFLNAIRQHLNAQDAPRLAGVKRLGVHDDEFVTPDTVLSSEGWTDDPEHVFIDDGNPLVDVLDIPEEGDEESVARALELLPQSRDPELFIPVIGWFYATAFRPTILDETGQFNHLAVFGETGAGKTMTTSLLSQMFGMGTNGFNPLDTAFVSLRTLSAGRGLPIWYDEYKPAEWSERGRRRFHADLRKAAAGQWARRGNADKSTDGFFLSAPVLLTGEQHLQGSAEQRRTIQTRFSTEATLDEACQNAYYELRDECDLHGHARLFYQWVLQQDDEEIRELWDSTGERIGDELPVGDIDDMAEQGLQTVLFGMNVYRSFAGSIDASPPELPVWDSLSELCDDTGADARVSHIEEFVELLGRAAVNGYLEEDVHYTIVKANELRINVSRGHDRVSKFIRDHDLTGVDLFDNSGDYTARFRDSDADWITCVGQNSPPVGRAVGIDLDLCDLIDHSAVSSEEEAEAEAEDGDDDTASEPTPIKELDGGYDTITARVNDVERPNAENAPTQAGRLVDESGPINFVCWARTPFDLAPDEHYRFENVDVGEYNGSPQAELVDGITTVEPIAAGEGHTESSHEILGEGGKDADADSGLSQDERLSRVKEVIDELCEQDGEAEHAYTVDVINAAEDAGIEESKANAALDKLSEQGDIYQPLTGQYRTNTN